VGGASKKKAKTKEPVAPAGYVSGGIPLTEPTLSGLSVASSEATKPKKSGAGMGAAKKMKGNDRLPPAVAASA
jgi:hypothetical protein